MNKLAIVILNWNGAEMMRQYLPSVIENSVGDVIVADNASTDGSVQMLLKEFPDVPVIVLEQNFGFAEGYNRALAQLPDYEYYLLLNSDVEIRQKDWNAPMIQYMDGHPECAVCQPKLLALREKNAQRVGWFEYAGAAGGYLDKYGYPFCRGRVMDTVEQDKGQYDEIVPLLWGTGAALMVRASDWKASGGLDSRFFAHMEEIDLCWRIHLSGNDVHIVTASEVFHLGGGSLPQGNPRKTYLNFRNSLFLLYKNLPLKDGKRMLIVRRLYDTLAFFMALAKFHWGDARAIIKAHNDYRRDKGRYKCQPQENLLKTFPGAKRNIVVDYYLRGKKIF